MQGINSTLQVEWWSPRLRWPNENQTKVSLSLMVSFLNKVWLLVTRKCVNVLSFKQGYSSLCLPFHLASSSVRDAIHTSHINRNTILFFTLLHHSPPNCPPHSPPPPTWQVFLIEVPLVLLIWKGKASSDSITFPTPPHPPFQLPAYGFLWFHFITLQHRQQHTNKCG